MAEVNWLGQTLGGRYQIRELLGHGGMSSVYKAFDPNLRREVAIKIIHSHLTGQVDFIERFEREAASVAQLRHPNIIQVHDFSREGSAYYIVFEYVAGETLQERLRRLSETNQFMSISEVKQITIALSNAIEYAHSKGIIHRDIKPANVILNSNNEPILMDFGITKILGGGKHTATGITVGTVQYMSPEQIKGEDVDARTDIYALGITLYEMLGGRAPFEANSTMALMMMHVQNEAPDPRSLRADIPSAFVDVVQRAIAKEPRRRYQRAADLARDVSWIKVDTGGLQTVVDYADPFETMMDVPPQSAPRYQPNPAPASKPYNYQATDVVQIVPPPLPSVAPSGQKRNKKMGVLLGIAALVLLSVILAGASFFFLSWPNVETLLAEARLLNEQGDYNGAIAIYDQILADVEPNNVIARQELVDVLANRAEQSLESADYAGAEADLEQARRINGGHGRVNFLTAQLYSAQERYTESIPYYENALDTIGISREPVLAGLGHTYSQLENYNKALETYTELVAIAPNNALAHQGQARAYYALEWYQDAIKPAQTWSELRPSDAEAYRILGISSRNLGMYEEAIPHYRRWRQLSTSETDIVESEFRLASALSELSQHEEAVGLFEQVTSTEPTKVEAWVGLGYSLRQLGRYENALDVYQTAITNNPNQAALFYGLGESHRQLRDIPSAITAYENAISINATAPQYFERVGQLYYQVEQYDHATEALLQAIELGLDNLDILVTLARSYTALGNYQQAITFFQRAIDQDPNDASFFYALGESNRFLENYPQAVVAYDRAIALNDSVPQYYLRRGIALSRLGDCQQAIADFTRIITLDSTNQVAKDELAVCQEQTP